MHFLKKSGGEGMMGLLLMIAFSLIFLFVDKPVVLLMRDMHKVSGPANLFLELIDPVMNFIGHGGTLLVVACTLCIYGGLFQRRVYGVGRDMLAGFAATGLAVQVLKHLIGRARPRITSDILLIGPSWKSGYDSFPSGHTAVAFCIAAILSRYFPKFRSLFYCFAVAIAFERVEDAAHFPSDVVVGAIIGLSIAKAFFVKKPVEIRSDGTDEALVKA